MSWFSSKPGFFAPFRAILVLRPPGVAIQRIYHSSLPLDIEELYYYLAPYAILWMYSVFELTKLVSFLKKTGIFACFGSIFGSRNPLGWPYKGIITPGYHLILKYYNIA